MVSLEELRLQLTRNAWQPAAVEIPLDQSAGRVISRDYSTDRNLPPFDRITMDGVAIVASAFQQGIRSFRCESQQFAGMAKVKHSARPDTCIEVATGAVVPDGCNAILPYEWLSREHDIFQIINSAEVRPGMNIHREGSDMTKGTVVLQKGNSIDQHAIAILASIGIAAPEVYSLPRTAIISTGDELVDVESTPLPHQIRKSNDLVISGLLQQLGIKPDLIHLPDSDERLTMWLGEHLSQYDLLVFSGGVSMGKKDYTPRALAAAGVQPVFHKVKQRPGKPLWFGRNENTTVFGLPGNPVSAAVSTAVHIRYWLTVAYSRPRSKSVVLDDTLTFKPELTRWMPVQVRNEHGVLLAKPIPGNNSGDFISLFGTTGLMEMPADQQTFERGSIYNYIEWQWNIDSHI